LPLVRSADRHLVDLLAALVLKQTGTRADDEHRHEVPW
jgi:hypothetical protein